MFKIQENKNPNIIKVQYREGQNNILVIVIPVLPSAIGTETIVGIVLGVVAIIL